MRFSGRQDPTDRTGSARGGVPSLRVSA